MNPARAGFIVCSAVQAVVVQPYSARPEVYSNSGEMVSEAFR
jgi:hypothetical protein